MIPNILINKFQIIRYQFPLEIKDKKCQLTSNIPITNLTPIFRLKYADTSHEHKYMYNLSCSHKKYDIRNYDDV